MMISRHRDYHISWDYGRFKYLWWQDDRPSLHELCFRTGSAGITHRIFEEMLQEGLTEEQARSRFYMVDKQGLLFDDDQN